MPEGTPTVPPVASSVPPAPSAGAGERNVALDVIEKLIDKQGKAPAGTKVVGLDGEVNIDGTTVKVADLVGLRTKAAEAEKTHAALVENLKLIYSEEASAADPVKAKAALVSVFKATGMDEATATKTAEGLFAEQPTNANGGSQRGTPTNKGTGSGSGEGEGQDTLQTAMFRDAFETGMKQAATASVQGNADLQLILKHVEVSRGAEEASKLRDNILGKITAEAKKSVGRIVRDNPGSYNTALLNQEAAKIATDTASNLRLVVGDPKNLGRTPSGMAGADPFDGILTKKPVAIPTIHTVKPADFEAGMEAYIKDQMARAFAAESHTGKV